MQIRSTVGQSLDRGEGLGKSQGVKQTKWNHLPMEQMWSYLPLMLVTTAHFSSKTTMT